jgi:hypothetical protein
VWALHTIGHTMGHTMGRGPRALAVIVVAGLVQGCVATSPRVVASAQERASMVGLEARVVVVQDEVLPELPQVGGTAATLAVAAGGLGAIVGAVIDVAAMDRAVNQVLELAPLYAATEDLDFRARFEQGLRSGLAGYPVPLASLSTTPVPLTAEAQLQARGALAPGRALMVVGAHYTFNDDFRTFVLRTTFSTWRRGDGEQPVHRTLLYYQSAPMGPGGQESVALWSAARGAALRAAVDEAIAETVALLRADQKLPAQSEAPEEMRFFAVRLGGFREQRVRGKLIGETADRWTVLSQGGVLMSLPKLEVAQP